MKLTFLLMLLMWNPFRGYSETSLFDRNVNNTTLLNPNCPATLTGVYADSPSSRKNRVSVHLMNQSEKRVIAVKVGFDGLDAVWDKHEFPGTYASAVSLRPEKEAQPIWRVDDHAFALNIASGVSVYLLKLMYADGSTWLDDGTRSCSLTVSGRAKPEPSDQ